MEPKQVEEIIKGLIAEYGWWIVGSIAVLASKDMIASFWAGAKVFLFGDFKPDDIIYISGRKAIIARMTVRRTVFYMYDRNTKMVVPNANLNELVLEKKLEAVESEEYLPKGSEKNKAPSDSG